jgi:ankyrin repeat protein
VKKLLSLGVDVNYLDKNGWTALHVAAKNNQEGAVQLLLEKGAAVKVEVKGEEREKDDCGSEIGTVLHMAA